MKRRGFSMVSFLWLTAISFLLGLLVLNLEDALRHRLSHYRDGLQARQMAQSGLRFGRAMLAQRRWNKEMLFVSPPLEDGSKFRLETRRQGNGWALSVKGLCRRAECVQSGRYP
ncbi:hypothetical protein IV102_22580 [bacterium]|nr:hypothetical protein [bacterium]